MAETRSSGQEATGAGTGGGQQAASPERAKDILQRMHDQGVIDLDAPMRQLFDRLETGDVSGYALRGGGEDIWVLVSGNYVLAGDD